MAEAVAVRTGCTVAQPVWYGSHPFHHLGMPGTVVMRGDLLRPAQIDHGGPVEYGIPQDDPAQWAWAGCIIPTAIHQFGKTYQVPAVIINLNWYHAVQDHFRLKSEGGVYETPFIHADEVETSWSLALFPELMDQSAAVDTVPRGYMPEGHVDKAGCLLHRPIAWYGHIGCGPAEYAATPEGCVGKATLASPEKAMPGVEAVLDYMVKLHDDILAVFPPGELPPIEDMSQRRREDIEAVLKGPLAPGGRSIYTLVYPPA